MLFSKICIEMDTYTDDDNEELDLDDQIENLCESKIDNFKGKEFCTPIVGKKLNNANHFSPVIFYGSPKGVRLKRQSRLMRFEDIWATFPRQEEAMNYSKEFIGTYIFSYQDHVSEQRRFLVSTHKEFWRRYKNNNCKFRHHYEVIQEGMPCHLYFDLEFNIRENARNNGDEMVDLLILIISECFLEKYSIEEDTNWIVELESSTKGGRDQNFEQLFISKDSSSADVPGYLFIDAAVYSRNFCFCLHLSSNAGKNLVLLPNGRVKEDVFMVSLICNVGAECEKLLICNMDIDFMKVLNYDTERNSDYSKSRIHNFLPIDGYLSGKSTISQER
nr:hypothetical protein [Tanacetum cinerariifolium]